MSRKVLKPAIRTVAGPRQGAALIEMAILMPVLILCFLGLVELGQYLTLAERVTKTSNQLAAVLYTMGSSELQSGTGPNDVIAATLKQAQTLARPYRSPTIVVRYCRRSQDADGTTVTREIYKAYTDPLIPACGEGPDCASAGATQGGLGAYVQTYACQTFVPALLPKYFTDGVAVRQTAFIPLSSTNQTALIEEARGTTVPAEPQNPPRGGGGPGPGPVGPVPPEEEECTGYDVPKPGGGCIDACMLYPTTTNPANPNDPNTVQGCLTARKECENLGARYEGGACVFP